MKTHRGSDRQALERSQERLQSLQLRSWGDRRDHVRNQEDPVLGESLLQHAVKRVELFFPQQEGYHQEVGGRYRSGCQPVEAGVCVNHDREAPGPGIPADRLSRIYLEFTGASSLTEGTGMGLAMTRQLIALMGGRVTVTSKLGVGTSFSLRLPGFV
jgi:Histidine kinase-, DNA gyrase B-, and HSP90-like ATPase